VQVVAAVDCSVAQPQRRRLHRKHLLRGAGRTLLVPLLVLLLILVVLVVLVHVAGGAALVLEAAAGVAAWVAEHEEHGDRRLRVLVPAEAGPRATSVPG